MVNEEDHVALVATAKGNDLKPAVDRLCGALSLRLSADSGLISDGDHLERD